MGVKAKLIQSNDDFNLYNLKEIRWFCDYFKKITDKITISDEVWNESLSEFKSSYGLSMNYELCVKLIKDFDEIYKRKKYYSDLKQYFREAKLDQANGFDNEIVYVSTFHKSKGREFENVFIMLESYQMSKEEDKRVLYVALTRAKRYLAVHHNGTYFDGLDLPSSERIYDQSIYEEPKSIVITLTHADVYLDYFKSEIKVVDQFTAGDELIVDETGCCDKLGNNILRFSSSFKDDLVHYFEKGYKLVSAKVKHCVYWKPKDGDGEYLIILPEVFLSKD